MYPLFPVSIDRLCDLFDFILLYIYLAKPSGVCHLLFPDFGYEGSYASHFFYPQNPLIYPHIYQNLGPIRPIFFFPFCFSDLSLVDSSFCPIVPFFTPTNSPIGSDALDTPQFSKNERSFNAVPLPLHSHS